MTFRALYFMPLTGLVCESSLAAQTAPLEQLAEITISATLRDVPEFRLPQSTTALDAATIRAAGVQHLEDLLGQVPNLAAAGGTSRPRYYQLRGVGEQEQYQGAPNPSVGFLIDDIDFSGVGMPATLIDVAQVEVLRGPQGTIYGANALAGLIHVRTREPGTGFEFGGEATLGDYDTRGAGFVVGDGDADGSRGWRLVAQRYRSDGFRRNAFLGRDDSSGYDEMTLRGRARWQFGARLSADLSLLHADLANGYDAWSIDNTRITQSDQPGQDAQRSTGAALRLTMADAGVGELRSISSAADSRIVFSYDGDWGNDAFWARQPACVPDPSLCVPYDFVSRTDRERRSLAEDLRLIGDDAHRLFGRASWLLGAYALRLREHNQQLDHYNGAIYRALDSAYQATSLALYGSVDVPLGERITLSTGLRAEQRRADYADSDVNAFTPTERMLGGNLSLAWNASDRRLDYLSLARGYKAGGFNIGTSIPAARRRFRPEYLWSLEAGTKRSAAAGRLRWQADVFYMRRVDQQVSTSVQTDPSDPLTYEFYTDNAARAENLGAETTLDWQTTPRWQLGGTLGLLRARYLDFSYNETSHDGSGNPVVVRRDLAGREQEYAPALQIALHVDYRHPAGYYARLDTQYSAPYYFSASHDQRARSRRLTNLRFGWQRGAWDASVWARNLFDARYAQHGFYFGNEPPDFATRLYLQPGDPRQIGVTLRYHIDAS